MGARTFPGSRVEVVRACMIAMMFLLTALGVPATAGDRELND